MCYTFICLLNNYSSYNYSLGLVLGMDDIKLNNTSICFQEPKRLTQEDMWKINGEQSNECH